MNFTVLGTLRHRFWGDYSAVVALGATRMEDVPHLAKHLESSGVPFEHIEGTHNCRVGPLTSEQVELFEAWVEPRRTDGPCRRCKRARHSIAGLEHSIDYGPAFDIELPYLDLATPLLPFPETGEAIHG